MSSRSIGTKAQLQDPDYMPPTGQAVALGLQHVLSMFVANVTPAIIVAGAAGFGFGSGSPDLPELLYLIQMAMLFAGIATLMQSIGFGPVGARLPILQGTSFAFLPIMIPVVAGRGVDALTALYGGIIVGGLFHIVLGLFIGRIRFALPPLVTGLVVMMIGLALVEIGIQYAAGGTAAIGTEAYGNLHSWSAALLVVVVTLGVKFFAPGIFSVSAVLIGLLTGYLYALGTGLLPPAAITESWSSAAAFALPQPFRYGVEFSIAVALGFCLMAFVSAVETVGDVEAITKTGANRQATDREITGATFANGMGTLLSGVFGSLPNTSFSQNVGLIAITGVMSRHVVTIGALFLILCGFIPKVGAVIRTIPIEVLGGGVIVMFGMVAAAGISILSEVKWNQRNMLIFAVSLSFGLGLELEPEAVQHLPETVHVLLTSGLVPAATLAILLNLGLPERLRADPKEDAPD